MWEGGLVETDRWAAGSCLGGGVEGEEAGWLSQSCGGRWGESEGPV